MAVSERIAASVRLIEKRLPYDKYPAFWFHESGPNGVEFRGITCAFLSHLMSMRNFPVVDPPVKYAPGQVLILLTPSDGVFEQASMEMARAKMPVSLLWKQEIAKAEVHYWITAVEIVAH